MTRWLTTAPHAMQRGSAGGVPAADHGKNKRNSPDAVAGVHHRSMISWSTAGTPPAGRHAVWHAVGLSVTSDYTH
ncbi:hypothetical protein Y032_0314g2215 [Ancylostoma ceylanicum]|nr:hypothetical protein Y032_0314g2215 [Ancylostoma ceylanicum]